jgi:hypothetical protein
MVSSCPCSGPVLVLFRLPLPGFLVLLCWMLGHLPPQVEYLVPKLSTWLSAAPVLPGSQQLQSYWAFLLAFLFLLFYF